MNNLESFHQDLHLKEIFEKISIKMSELDGKSIDDVVSCIDNLPRRITIEKNHDVHDYIFSVFKNENYGHADAYYAMYIKRNAKSYNNNNFLFSVRGGSFAVVLNKFLFAYECLIDEGVIQGRAWKSKFKNIEL